MIRTIPFCVFLAFCPNTILAKEIKTEIKEALSEIQDSIKSNKDLKKNRLRNFEFDSYISRRYLYYYRAFVDSLLLKNKKDSDKLELIEDALQDLENAEESPVFNETQVDELSEYFLKEKIETAYRLHNYKTLQDTIQSLNPEVQNEIHNVLYYAYALFKTSQTTDFKRLAKKYLIPFRDKNLLQRELGEVPDWFNILDSLSEDMLRSKVKLARESLPDLSHSSILAHPARYFEYLGRDVYLSSSTSVFKACSSLYFFVLRKEERSLQERKFQKAFESRMPSFAPSFQDELITSLWKRKETKQAEFLSKAFLGKYEGHPSYPKVLYNLGRIQEDSKRYAEALKSYKHLISKSDDANYLENARFRAAWVQHLAKKQKDAKALYEDYLKYHPEGRYASTCDYFLLKMGKSGLDQEKVQAYIDRYPLSLYSLLLIDDFHLKDELITNLLPSLDTLRAIENQLETFKADISTLNKINVSKELLEFDLKADASKLLKSIPFDDRNHVLTLYLSQIFHNIQDTNGEESMLVRAFVNFDQVRKHIPWQGLFPKYRLDTIAKILKEQDSDISPYLVLSIIRQESAFDHEARSTANALGLMQLTTDTARQAARALQLKTFSLTDEEDNLRLGIQTISKLLKKFDNRLDYALSAYNAGETVTQLWIDLRGDLQPIEFIESIPYQETRLYVKDILRNFGVYQLLYSKRPQTLVSYQYVEDKNGEGL